MLRRCSPIAAASWLLLAALPADASVSLSLDLEALVARSDAIVVGTVLGRDVLRDGYDRIVSDYAIRVEETMKGVTAPGGQIVLRCLGGSIGDVGMRVEGEPHFRDGDRAVLFAVARHGHLRPVGMSQGVLPVRVEAGVPTVHPGAQGMSLVRRVAGGALVPAPGALLGPRPMAEVSATIRELVAREGR